MVTSNGKVVAMEKGTAVITATAKDGTGVSMVNKNGKVVCLGEGKATITATTNDGSNLSASCVFNCVPVGIEDAKQDGKKSVIHSVSGARRTTTRKGINIINGKKVLVK